MNFLLVPDKFKGSMPAKGVIRALRKGIARAIPEAKFVEVLASDGGDGFLDAVAEYRDLETVLTDTVGPLGKALRTEFLLDRHRREAYIELARTSGLVLLAESERNPMKTSTVGTGMQIRRAVEEGAEKVYVGLGGSATNDGGTGIAQAMGYNFLDASGNRLDPTGGNLRRIRTIDRSLVIAAVGRTSVIAINDVDNPLFGVHGAARVYASQKGATGREINMLDAGLKQLDMLVRAQLGSDCAQVRGSGAAGGTAYGLKAFLGAEFISGIRFILELAEVPRLLREQKFDYLITGEGKIDRQTLRGKLIDGVCGFAEQHGIPVIAVCGTLEVERETLGKYGIADVLEIMDRSKPLAYSMTHGEALLEDAVYDYFDKRK